MRQFTIELDSSNPRFVRVKYENGTVYHGEVDKNYLKNGLGRYYDNDGQLLQLGEWMDDDLIKEMSDDEIEKSLHV